MKVFMHDNHPPVDRDRSPDRFIGYVLIVAGLTAGMVAGGVIGALVGNPDGIMYLGAVIGPLAGFGLSYLIIRRRHS